MKSTYIIFPCEYLTLNGNLSFDQSKLILECVNLHKYLNKKYSTVNIILQSSTTDNFDIFQKLEKTKCELKKNNIPSSQIIIDYFSSTRKEKMSMLNNLICDKLEIHILSLDYKIATTLINYSKGIKNDKIILVSVRSGANIKKFKLYDY
jgi:hypothetical protein